MDELKSKASPYTKLAHEIKLMREELAENQVGMLVLLGNICDQKDEQAKRDIEIIKFLKKTNRTGLKFTIVMAMIALLAFSLDVIRIDDTDILKERIIAAANLLKGDS